MRWIEYAGAGGIALALWLLPRPLGWTPQQTGIALLGTTALTGLILARSQAAVLEVNREEWDWLEQEKAEADQQAQRLAFEQEKSQLLAAVQQAAEQKDAELAAAYQSRLAELQQAETALAVQQQQPSLLDRAKRKVEEDIALLQYGLELSKAQLTAEAALNQHRQQLELPDPQSAQAEVMAKLIEMMSRIDARLSQTASPQQTVSVQARAVPPYPSPGYPTYPATPRAAGRGGQPGTGQRIQFTEPSYNPDWGYPDPDYDTVHIE